MEVIQLTILALLANGLGGTNTTNNNSTSVHESTTLTPTVSRSTKDAPLITSRPSTDLPSNTSTLTSTPHTTSQLMSKTSPETPSIQNSTSQPISYMTTINQTSKPTTMTPITNEQTTIPSTTHKPTTHKPTTHKPTTATTTIKNEGNGSVGRIIAYIVGGLLLLMLVTICILLLRKRCSSYPVQDAAWAGTYPGSDEDAVLAVENNDNDTAPTKRPSLTTFLSKKKRESLLDQYSMDVQEPEGIINPSSPKNEEKLIGPAEVKVENETGKETSSSEARETQSQDFPTPPDALISLNDNDPATPPPATGTEAPGPPQEVPDADPNITSLPPPPMDFLDLVNDPDFPPPLPETQA
ncbi:uncharacterized protein LOC144501240 [Mustelus asterias]